MRFKIGQKVVCISTKGGITSEANDNLGRTISGRWVVPKYGEIVTVSCYSLFFKNHIELCEYQSKPNGSMYPPCFDELKFEPLADISELESILNTEEVRV